MNPFSTRWKPEPDYTRLLRAIQRSGDPHYVPRMEMFANIEVMDAFLGEPILDYSYKKEDRRLLEKAIDQDIRFWYHLGYSSIWQPAVLYMPGIAAQMTPDPSNPNHQRSWSNEKDGPIGSWADFENHPWPAAAEADYTHYEILARRLPEGMGIFAGIPGSFEMVKDLFGYERLAVMLYDCPDLVQAVFDKISDLYLPIARSLIQMDRVLGLWGADDMGFKTGTLISPKHLRKYALPYHKTQAETAHQAGKPYILHSCGNLYPSRIIDDLIDEVGIDAKHSFEDVILPVEQFISRYGDRVAAVGGIDIDLLVRGTEADIRRRTRQVLEACADSRAYILGTGNSVANYIPLENFLVMLDEGNRFNAGI